MSIFLRGNGQFCPLKRGRKGNGVQKNYGARQDFEILDEVAPGLVWFSSPAGRNEIGSASPRTKPCTMVDNQPVTMDTVLDASSPPPNKKLRFDFHDISSFQLQEQIDSFTQKLNE